MDIQLSLSSKIRN